MFFLIRMAFWLGIVLLLLPISTSEDGTRQIGAWQALSAAQSALSDVSGFCQRQPDACAVGGQLLGHLGDKAQAGAKWLFENVGSASDVADTAEKAAATIEKAAAGHGLTPQDLAPTWGGETADAPKAAKPEPVQPASIQPANVLPVSVPLPPRRPA